MKRSVKICTILSFTIMSTFFGFLAYVFVDALPLPSSNGLFFLFVGALCAGVAVWSFMTLVGVARVRKWARTSALLLGPTAIVVYVLPVASYAYVAATTPDVGWSWMAVLPLVAIIPVVIWWLLLFTSPELKRAFSSQHDHESR